MTSESTGVAPQSGQRARRLADARGVFRTEGLRGVWFRALAATLYRRVVVMERPLDEPIREVAARTSIAVGLLTDADADAYAAFRPDTTSAEVRRRLRAGHWCFVARHQGRIVHAGWATRRGAWMEYLGCEFPLEPGDVYQYESYTAPAFRGFDVATARVVWMLRFFRDAGARRLLAVVWPENVRAFRPLQKAGYHPIGTAGYVGLGRWRARFYHRRRFARTPASGYWDGVMAETRQRVSIDPWRGYMEGVYRRLLRQWLPTATLGRGLKTDLFEEAVTPHHVLPALGPGSLGLDCSPAIVVAARERLSAAGGTYPVIVADVRAIPVRSGAIARILAGSSLDHFADKGDIAVSLAELARVLGPGGTLVVTFDNPHNPAVWLRNRLPFAWLRRLGLVPYYVGHTYNRAEARAQLERVGLAVTHVTAVAHAPRAPSIWLVALAERMNARRLQPRVARVLDAFERLERWPTRYRTGYYLALRAQKPRPRAAPP